MPPFLMATSEFPRVRPHVDFPHVPTERSRGMDAAEARARLRVMEGADEAALYEARSKMIRYHYKTLDRPEWNAPQCKLINTAFAVLFAELHAAANTAPTSSGAQNQAVPGSKRARVEPPPVIEEEEEEEVIIVSIDDPHDAHAGDLKVEADLNYTTERGVAL